MAVIRPRAPIRESRYNDPMQTQVFELQGTLDLRDLTRFQYFHTLRRTWPLAVFFALILIFVLPLAVLAMAAKS